MTALTACKTAALTEKPAVAKPAAPVAPPKAPAAAVEPKPAAAVEPAPTVAPVEPKAVTPPAAPKVAAPPAAPKPPATVGGPGLLLPVKDTRVSAYRSERGYNCGGGNRLRVSGIAREAAIVTLMDFGSANVKRFLDANADKEIAGQLVLTPYPGDMGSGKLEAATLDSAVDWGEGDKVDKPAAKGESSFLAAQTGEKKWATADGKEVGHLLELVYDKSADKIRTLANSKSADVKKEQKTVTLALDAAFIKRLAEPTCRGVVLFTRGQDKLDFYARSKSGSEPKLVLTAK